MEKLKLLSYDAQKERDQLIQNSFSIKEKTNSAFDTFIHACIRTFETDAELIKNCNFNQFFVMEKFVSSDQYFSMMFKKITNMEVNNFT